MGWLSTHYNKHSFKSLKDFFQQEFGAEYKIEGFALRGRNVAYSAIRHPLGYVFGCVFLLQWNPRSEYNISYKEVAESMGPNEQDAPLSILKMLSPLDQIKEQAGLGTDSYKWSKEWREACLRNAQERQSIKKGMTVEFKDGRSIKILSLRPLLCEMEGRTYKISMAQILKNRKC